MEWDIDYKPQINPRAITFLESIIRPDWKVFEYGSGQSTIYFARRVAEMVSVEHHPRWVKTVNDLLDADELEIRYLYIEAAPGRAGRDPYNPLDYCCTEHDIADWRTYACAIDGYRDAYFDLVFVDGGARCSCIYHGYRKVALGGYLLLDDSERDTYHKGVSHHLEGWQRRDFAGRKGMGRALSKATFWRRHV